MPVRRKAERIYPQRLGDSGIDGDPTDTDQHVVVRIRGQQHLAGSVETHDARGPIIRKPVEKMMTFGNALVPKLSNSAGNASTTGSSRTGPDPSDVR